jgi:hypothetical protein
VILNRRVALFVIAALALVSAGCGGGKVRPPHVAVNPGECFVDLSDPEVRIDGSQVIWKVRYKFTENQPHPDAWFQCKFAVEGGGAGTASVTKQARAMGEEGEFEGTMNTSFLRKQGGTFTFKVGQSKSKEGPYNDVSDKIGVEL